MQVIYNLIDEFFVAYLKNQLNDIINIFDPQIRIRYSTVGEFNGIDSTLNALAFNKQFDIHTTTITNVLPIFQEDKTTIYLFAHHLVANEKGHELYPLCFGGKYTFVLKDNKIVEINYAQEYQVENTLYIKGWKFAKPNPDLTLIKESFDSKEAYLQVNRLESNTDKAIELTKLFCYALDSKDTNLYELIADNSIHLERYKTMSYGKFECLGKENIHDFISQTRNYYYMDQYSIKVNDVVEDDSTITVLTSHLVPQRTGTKKLNVNTKYHSFFDEDIKFTFIKKEDSLYLKEFLCKKITDVHYNGFDILHL